MRIGLTGGIASGKSTVAARLAELGAVVIDADELAREAVESGTPGLDAVVASFGRGVLRPDGTLDRAALGRVVFADEGARRKLEAIVHPEVRRLADLRERAAPPGSVVVHVIPLLVETGQERDFDQVVVVDLPEDVQLERLLERGGGRTPAAQEQARARIAAQASRDQRREAADVILDNSGSRAALIEQTDALWASWQSATGSKG